MAPKLDFVNQFTIYLISLLVINSLNLLNVHFLLDQSPILMVNCLNFRYSVFLYCFKKFIIFLSFYLIFVNLSMWPVFLKLKIVKNLLFLIEL
jgi:hypothetical protein